MRSHKIGKMSNILLNGDSGSGKSTVLLQLQIFLENQGYINCHWINCKQLIGKRPEVVKNLLTG